MQLDDLGSVGRGKSKHRPRNDPALYGGAYPFVQTGDVKEAGLWLTHYTQTYNDTGLAQSKLWPVGTLCITIAANIAETAILKIPACFPDSIVGFIPYPGKADARFIKYYIDTIKLRMQNASKGTTQDNLSVDKLLSFDFHVPNCQTQERIASILSAYDDLIENDTRRIKILEEMVKMIYREWFVDFRFPGHEKVKIVESGSGPIPQGWCVEPLGEHLSVVETGNRPKGGVGSFSEGVPSLGAESITGVGRFDYAKTKHVPVEYFQKMKLGILQDRDVLVYKDGGQPGNFHPHVSLVGDGFPFSKMVINSHVYRLRTTERVTQDFLYYHLSSDESLNWMRRNGTGSAIPGLARKDLLRLPMILAPTILIRQFDDFARALTSQILVIAKRIKNLSTTREFMLPKLVSGEVSVEQFETEAVTETV